MTKKSKAKKEDGYDRRGHAAQKELSRVLAGGEPYLILTTEKMIGSGHDDWFKLALECANDMIDGESAAEAETSKRSSLH